MKQERRPLKIVIVFLDFRFCRQFQFMMITTDMSLEKTTGKNMVWTYIRMLLFLQLLYS